MDAGNHNVHLGERRVFEIERAIAQNVHLDPGSTRIRPPNSARSSASTSRMLRTCASARASSSPFVIARFFEWSVIAIYAKPSGHRRLRHLADRVAAIRRLGMHVQIAADIGPA